VGQHESSADRTDGDGDGGGILAGVRILDLAEGLAGSVAGLLLAECGADVVKVEAPGARGHRHPYGVRTWDRSKRSVVLDLDTVEGRGGLEPLLGASDVVIHEFGPSRATALGLDDAALGARHPRLIVSSVLAWPRNHPGADRPVDELLAMARLGVCDEQRAMRRPGPVFVRFPLGSWGAAYLAAAGIAARLLARQRGGPVGPAHTSLVQGAMVPMGMHWSRAERPTPVLALGMPKESGGSQISLFRCADGVWIHLMKSPDDAPLMQAALEAMGVDGVAEANRAAAGLLYGYPNQGANAAAFLTRPSAEWLAELWAHDIPAQAAAPLGAVFDDDQARVNGYVVDLDDPEAGAITVSGLPLTLEPAMRISCPAPRPGADQDAVPADWAAPRASDGGRATAPDLSRRWPLEGLKVLDLGSFLAGPYGPMLLADLGADVIKVEATTGDAMRHVEWSFAGCQRGKRSLALDLKAAAARPVLEALVGWADVVHHNVRMPAARRLGIDYDSLRAVKPDLVYCHTSSYGPIGPRADWPGYDQLFQAQCGWEILGAGEGNPPMWHRFGFMDHQCALASVVATILAVYHRDRTGQGQAVAASLLGAGALTASEIYRRADGSLTPHAQVDADQTGTGPGYGLIEVHDGWVAVAAREPEQLAALLALSGASDPQGIAAGLRHRSRPDLLAALAAAGVAAEPVEQHQRDQFLDDPANRAAGLVATYAHAEWGQLEQPGALWDLGDLQVRLDRAPPALGQHTTEILAELGLSGEQIAALCSAGVARAG